MGVEILQDGVLYVNRKKVGDAEYLLSIRNGDVAYEDVKKLADDLLAKIKEIKTELSEQVDREFLNQVCVELVEMSGVC